MNLTESSREERARLIRVARAGARLNQDEVAERAGLNQGTVSKAEHGRGSEETFDLIEAALGLAS